MASYGGTEEPCGNRANTVNSPGSIRGRDGVILTRLPGDKRGFW